MKQIKIGLFGASGKMGQELIDLIQLDDHLLLHETIEKGSSNKKTKKPDVWIDFSSPDGFQEALKIAQTQKIPLVSGTTGISSHQKDLLKKASKKIPILWASNMSLGIVLLKKALKVFSDIDSFDFQIEEIHHKHKKDKPSGTAITLQNNLEIIVKKPLPAALSIRGGGVFGIHKIYAMSEEEVLTFEHVALNRRVFAKGAIKAAKWLIHQKNGLYTIDQVLD